MMSMLQPRWTLLAVLATALATLGAAFAQDEAKKDAAGKSKSAIVVKKKARKGGLLPGGANPPNNVGKGVGDPLAKGRGDDAGNTPRWPYHFKFKLVGKDGVGLGARFYPSKAGPSAPVLLMVHAGGAGHSGADFEEKAEGLKDQSIADYLQEKEYAVLIVDRRGHGAGLQRQQVNNRETQAQINDFQTAYTFLIDRHNRRELNLAKLGVVAVGDGANLTALWAATPNAGTSSPGRVGDLAALVLVSPQLEAFHTQLTASLATIAPRMAIMLMGGERDNEAFKAARPIVERGRGRGVLFDTRLQAERLLRFEPKAVEQIDKFLEDPVKFRSASEWEPRYLLEPIVFTDIELIQAPAQDAVKKAAEPAKKKDEADKKDAEKKGAEKKKNEPAPEKAETKKSS